MLNRTSEAFSKEDNNREEMSGRPDTP